MKQYYLATIRHSKETESGLLKLISEQFLTDAVSFTDAETKAYEFAEENCNGEFSIKNVRKTNISEVITISNCDPLWQVRVVYTNVDADSDKEVKVNYILLIEAEEAWIAIERVKNYLSAMFVPYHITEVKLTKILEVI